MRGARILLLEDLLDEGIHSSVVMLMPIEMKGEGESTSFLPSSSGTAHCQCSFFVKVILSSPVLGDLGFASTFYIVSHNEPRRPIVEGIPA